MVYSIRSIVAGVISPHDDPIHAPALELARRCNAFLHVVHAPELADLQWRESSPSSDAEGAASRDGVSSTAAPGPPESPFQHQATERVDYHMLSGSPGDVVLDGASSFEADLIIVGASRRSRLAGALLGTTARHVVRHAEVPVFVLRGDAPHKVSRVLVTTDLSEMSAGAHEIGLDIVECLFASEELTIRALEVVFDDPSLVPPLRGAGSENLGREELEEYLAARRPRVRPLEPRVRFGDPEAEIVAEAEGWGADLIVLGTHGRTGAARVLLGNTAEGVLGRATASTLVIPRRAVERNSRS